MTAGRQVDFLVVGGGVVGISTAWALRRRFHQARVVVLEKERHSGAHASGRNSGVLHAGFYYAADSMKAKLCRAGNHALTEYCLEHGLNINRCGKVVVAHSERELPALDTLRQRALDNGVELHDLDEGELKQIEPHARTVGRALFSPTTASVDPGQVMQRMTEDATAAGVDVRYGVRYLNRAGGRVRTSDGDYNPRYLVNTAGLYADRVARDFGFSSAYRLVPFKGLYVYSDQRPGALRSHVYPVPDMSAPFLGVHFTVAVDGRNKIGPTAIPAFWREQYDWHGNFDPGELAEVLASQAGLFWQGGGGFRRMAVEEMKKYYRPYLIGKAGALVEGVDLARFGRWGRPGIRAQLVRRKTSQLEMDFVLEGDQHSMHVLNAVSPAFTCAMPFAELVVDRIAALMQ